MPDATATPLRRHAATRAHARGMRSLEPLRPSRAMSSSVRVGQVAGRGVRLPSAMVPMGTVFTADLVEELGQSGADEVELLEEAEDYAAMVASDGTSYRAQVLEGMLHATHASRNHGPIGSGSPDPVTAPFQLAVATLAWFPPAAELLLSRGFTHDFLGPAVETADLAARTGAHLGMDQEELIDLIAAAIMADAGMLLLPDDLVAKPARLTPEERMRMQQHVRLGEELLEPLRILAPAVPAVAAQHHERVDGTGYPQRIAGDQMSLEAQIVAVSHRYLAATTPRPYRPALPVDDAVDLVTGCAGRIAGDEVVAAFTAAVDPYPPGALVRLSDGRGGCVLEHGSPGARVVQVMWDDAGDPIAPREVAVGRGTGSSVVAVSLCRGRAALDNPSMRE